MRANLSLLVLAALAMTLCAASAQAQGWLADRSRAEGRGIRLGDFELHPGVGAEGGYTSNVFLSEEPALDSAILRVAPHLFLQTAGSDGEAPRPVAFRAGVSGSLLHYFSTSFGTAFAIGQDAKLTLRPGQIFSLELSEEFRRSVDPFTEAADPNVMDGDPDVNFARDRLNVGARAQLGTPGGVLKAGLGYKFGIDHFEDDAFRDNRSNSHTVGADTSWEFFPKTALIWDGSVLRNNFIRSTDELTPAEQASLTATRNDSTSLRTRLGLNGALTSRIGFTVAGGYGAGFYDSGDDFEAFIAQVEARWKPQETISWSLGYDRETMPSFQGNFLLMNRVKTAAQMLLGGVVVIQGRVELSFLDFGNDPIQGERDDIHLLGNLSGEYRITDWFAITAEASYWENFTDFVFVTGTGPNQVRDEARYRRIEGWLGVRAFL